MDCTLDSYIDYLLATTKLATATGMSELMAGEISHDKVTRFLAESHLDSSTVWNRAKRLAVDMRAVPKAFSSPMTPLSRKPTPMRMR